MYHSLPAPDSPSICCPVPTARVAMMDPGDRMAALKDIVGFDPLIIDQEREDVSVFERLRAALEPVSLGAWQLSNGVHLALSHLITAKILDTREATVIHALFLHQT